jgi:uncharacterized protein DUF4012
VDEPYDSASSPHGDHGDGDTGMPRPEDASILIEDSPISAQETTILEPSISSQETTILEPSLRAAGQTHASVDGGAPSYQLATGGASEKTIFTDPSPSDETPEAISWAARVNAAFDALDAYDVFTEPQRAVAPAAPIASERETDAYQPSQRATSASARPSRQRRTLTPRVRRRALLSGLIFLCFLLGYGGIVGAFTVTDALAAARDAKAQGAAIQALISGGHLTDVATLTQLRGRLLSLDSDLSRIQSDVPAQPLVSGVFGGAAPLRALRMAQDLTQAGLHGVDAGLLIAPHIKGVIGSLTATSSGGSAKSAGSSTTGSPLTLDEINQASAHVNAAGTLVIQALAERAQLSDSDLQALGLGSFVHILHTLDTFAPKLPTYLGYGRQILAALPDLLGITKPVNYLLFDLDSDELRPSGGFQGVYSVLTFKGARLANGVHLQNIYAIDCPNGFPPNCAVHLLPASYNWFTYHDGLRNANLDPSYPATARLDEHMLAVDRGPAVAGVISLTPIIIQQALTLTGPLSVPGYPDKLTAQNFTELIHYYHSITGSANISKTKAFDAAAGSALLHGFSKLSQQDQSKFMQLIMADLRAGDLQVYFNDQRVESVLSALGMDGGLQKPAGDTFEVVNANHGANYANADVTATQTDQVVIDAHGSATHTLTISYHFPARNHRYTSQLVDVYRDFIQVLAPSQARLLSIRGCAPVTVTEPGWADWGCDMTLWRGRNATVVFKWVTPNATTKAPNGAIRYNLLVQRQSGTHDGLSVTVTPPAGARLAQPLAAGLKPLKGDQVRYDATLTEDRAISVTWAG